MFHWEIIWAPYRELRGSGPPLYRYPHPTQDSEPRYMYPHTAQGAAKRFARDLIEVQNYNPEERIGVVIVGPSGAIARRWSGTLGEFVGR